MEKTSEEIVGYKSLELTDSPTYTTIRDKNDTITDYQNVKIAGYASKFNLIDRCKDTVLPGAYLETLSGAFAKNPILCFNHSCSTGVNGKSCGIGNITIAREDEIGLWIEAEISNAPNVKDTRFKIVERVYRTLSVKGVFYGTVKPGGFSLEQGRYLHKIDLEEISIVPVPMDSEATFEVKSLTNSTLAQPEVTEIEAIESPALPKGIEQETLQSHSVTEEKANGEFYVVIDGERVRVV